MKRLLKAMLVTAATLAVTGSMSPASLAEPTAVQQFRRLVAAYIALHERVEQPLPPLRVSSDAHDISQAVDAMADAMRAARPDARVGDIFTPEIAGEFRRRLQDEVRARGYVPSELIAAIVEQNDDDEPCAAVSPTVNQSWDCGFALTLPFFLDVLPPLPDELQYRFVGRTLMVLDVHSQLVVDILPEALPID